MYIVNERVLKECLVLDGDAVAQVENAFGELQRGNATVPPILMVPVPEQHGEVDVKTAYIPGLEYFAIKVASGFFNNRQLGLPSASGLMLLISTQTGFPEAVLLDNGYLTQVRTGAAGAVAARYLAPERTETVGIIGSGTQARFQLRALSLVRKPDRVVVYSAHDEAGLPAYVEEMQRELGVTGEVVDTAERVVRSSSVVVSTTPAREPVIKAEWLHPGLHITAMGSDTEEKQELEAECLAKADLVVSDLKTQGFRLGELRSAKAAGVLDEGSPIVQLGELVLGEHPGRSSQEQITICDLTGVGVQDTAIALEAYRRVVARGTAIQIAE